MLPIGTHPLPLWRCRLDLAPYERRDTAHVDAAQRPTKSEYDRYLALVQFGRECGWMTSASLPRVLSLSAIR